MEPDEKVKRLYKSRTDRMIDGVCAGVAEYIGIDPVLVRIAFLLLAFAGGVGVIAYIVAMILMPAGSVPATPAAGAAGSKSSTDSTARIVGIGFLVLGGILLLGNLGVGFWDHWWGLSWSSIAPILIIAAGVALVLRSPRITPAGQTGGTHAGEQGIAGAAAGTASPGGRLYRARLDRKFLGVCGGLGTYLSVDPTILRLLFVISAIASFGMTILLYLITAIIVPAEPLAARPA